MKLSHIMAAAGIALASLGAASGASAQPYQNGRHDRHYDNGRHDDGRRWHGGRRWNGHGRNRCHTEWRHHHRVRICR